MNAPFPGLVRAAAPLARWLGNNWYRVAVLSALLAALASARQYLDLLVSARVRDQDRAEERQRNAEERAARAYVAKRRMDCYDVYARERARFSNVTGTDYDEELDLCEVIYGSPGRREDNSACRILRDTTFTGSRFGYRYVGRFRSDCAENTFRKTF